MTSDYASQLGGLSSARSRKITKNQSTADEDEKIRQLKIKYGKEDTHEAKHRAKSAKQATRTEEGSNTESAGPSRKRDFIDLDQSDVASNQEAQEVQPKKKVRKDHIDATSSQINHQADFYLPPTLFTGEWNMDEEVQLPVTLASNSTQDNRTITIDFNPHRESASFWEVVAYRVKQIRDTVEGQSFGTALSGASVEAMRLSEILFPTLLNHAGGLEYQKTNIADTKLTKGKYKKLVKMMVPKLAYLEYTLKSDAVEASGPLTKTGLLTSMLVKDDHDLQQRPNTVVAGNGLTYHEHLQMKETLACSLMETAEFLRRELVAYGESIKYPLDEYRKLRVEVHGIARAILVMMGDQEDTHEDNQLQGKQPVKDAEDNQPQGKQPVKNNPRFPAAFLRYMTDSHHCLCAVCSPNHEEVLKNEVRQEVEKEMVGKLREEKLRLQATMTAEWESGREKSMEDRIRKDILRKLGA